MADWEGGICGCFDDMETCIKSFICAPVFVALAKSEWDGTNCVLNFCCFGPHMLRHQVRTIHGIEGNCVADVCIAQFCFPCSLAQVMRTMKKQGPIHKSMR